MACQPREYLSLYRVAVKGIQEVPGSTPPSMNGYYTVLSRSFGMRDDGGPQRDSCTL